MTCEEMMQAMNSVIDDQAALELCSEFAEHLIGCNPCKVVIDNIRKTIQLYQADQPYPMPEAFQARFRQALMEKWRNKFPGNQ